MRKRFIAKIYSLAGAYIKTLDPDQIMNEVSFSMKTGGGQGQCTLDLNLPIDDFQEGTTIKDMNIVKIYESDDTFSPAPRLIYTGFISQYAPFFSGASEGVRLTLLGLVSMLSLAYYQSGGSYTVGHSAVDPSAILSAIITHFNTVYTGSWIGTSGGHVSTVGTNVTYTFEKLKWYDALKKVIEFADADWWWYIGADGEVYFQDKPTTETHKFTIGKTVEEGEILKNNEKIVNKYVLSWGTVPTISTYQDATSQTSYGVREKLETDAKITTSGTADQQGAKVIADNKDRKVEARIRVNSRYNIESIKPGHTCTILNTKKGSGVLPQNMLITAVTYSPDGVTLTLENQIPSLADNFIEAVESITA